MIFRLLVSLLSNIFSPFHFLWGPVRKNCCIFVNRNGREMLTLEAEGIHRHRHRAGACIMCGGSSLCASLLTLSEIQTIKTELWREGAGLSEAGALPATDPGLGLPFGNVLLGTSLLLQLPGICLHITALGSIVPGSVGITHHLCLFLVGALLAQGKDLRCESIHQRAQSTQQQSSQPHLCLSRYGQFKNPGLNSPFYSSFGDFTFNLGTTEQFFDNHGEQRMSVKLFKVRRFK